MRRRTKLCLSLPVKSISPKHAPLWTSSRWKPLNEVGVDLKQGYNGHLTSREAGSVGGQMVKKMIEDYENKIK